MSTFLCTVRTTGATNCITITEAFSDRINMKASDGATLGTTTATTTSDTVGDIEGQLNGVITRNRNVVGIR